MIWGPTIGGEPGHSLGCDNVDGGYQATRHLLENGRRRIALLGTHSPRSPELANRYDGYAVALRESGIELDERLQVEAASSQGCGYQAVLDLLERGVDFDAIFAVTDAIAIDAMRALGDNGYSIPGDVAVVGFDDMPLAAYVTPPLTTMRQDIRQAAEGLVRGIVGLIEGEPVESSLMAPRLVVRASCGAL